jgi:predicted MFS family arabinose efflux permease
MKAEEKNTFISMLVWLSLTLFYCYQYVLRMLPNIIMPEIMNKYHIGASEFGSFSGIYYIGYIIVHIPIGVLLTRFGGKAILPLCIALTASGLIPLVYFDIWETMIIGRALTGIGSSAAVVGALQTFRIIYPDKFARMLGFTVSASLITVVYIGAPLTNIIKSIGLDAAINILICSGIALAIITYIIMPKATGEVSHSDILSDIKAVICNYKLLFTSLFAGLMVGPMEGFADAWGSAFMTTVYGIEKAEADHLTLSILFGMFIGCIILPYIADKTRLYIGVTIASGIGMIICFIYMLSGNAAENSLYYTCLTIGIFCAYQVVIISKIATYVSEARSGLAAAAANMIIMAFGWFFHNAIGMRLDKLWDGTLVNGIKSYSSDAFISSISIIPIAISLAVIGFTLIGISTIIHARMQQEARAI